MGSDINAPFEAHEKDNSKLIVELCKVFFEQGWMPGTSGAMSILEGSLYVTPSGVQKERMRPEDVRIYDTKTNELVNTKKSPLLKATASLPVFTLIHQLTGAGACIHTHSTNSMLSTLLFEDKFRMTQVENIKAIPSGKPGQNLGFFDTLEIPIIANQAHEEMLVDDIKTAIQENPGCCAVLVRRHGVYTWGRDIWKTKIILETLEYLFEIAIKKQQMGIKQD